MDLGNCPICGMTFEPVIVKESEEPSAELKDITDGFWVSLMLAVPVFVLEMGGHFLDLHRYIAPQFFNCAQFALASPWLYGLVAFLRRGTQSLMTLIYFEAATSVGGGSTPWSVVVFSAANSKTALLGSHARADLVSRPSACFEGPP